MFPLKILRYERDHQPAVIFRGVSFYLLDCIVSSAPVRVKRQIQSKSRSASLGFELLPSKDSLDDLFGRGSPLRQSRLRVRMEPDVDKTFSQRRG
jgi:hypothetical protein